jgi:hypothetical protein
MTDNSRCWNAVWEVASAVREHPCTKNGCQARLLRSIDLDHGFLAHPVHFTTVPCWAVLHGDAVDRETCWR